MKLYEVEKSDFSSMLYRVSKIEIIHQRSWKTYQERWNGPECYNQVLRWGWGTWTNGRSKLSVLLFLPRLGEMFCIQVSVKKEDEPAVREYLQRQWQYVKELWQPVSEESNEKSNVK